MDTVRLCFSQRRNLYTGCTACCRRLRDVIRRPLSEQVSGLRCQVFVSARLSDRNFACYRATAKDEQPNSLHFSSAFHKESRPSTDSAQSGAGFCLKRARARSKVLTSSEMFCMPCLSIAAEPAVPGNSRG